MKQRLFARGEVGQAGLEVLRQAGKPLSVADIACRVLEANGMNPSDVAMVRRIRSRLQWAFFHSDKAGITMVVTRGPGALRGLATAVGLTAHGEHPG